MPSPITEPVVYQAAFEALARAVQLDEQPALIQALRGLGYDRRNDLTQYPPEVLRAVLETNNLGMAATFQPFIAPMRARRSGRLVGIASVAGVRGLPGHAAYSLSKAGVINWCESLRTECRADGVRVVTIAPGYIDTPLTRQNAYRMPFLMSPEAFAARALDAIDRGVSFRVIPWQMGVVARVLRVLPDWLYDRLIAGRPRKARQGQ